MNQWLCGGFVGLFRIKVNKNLEMMCLTNPLHSTLDIKEIYVPLLIDKYNFDSRREALICSTSQKMTSMSQWFVVNINGQPFQPSEDLACFASAQCAIAEKPIDFALSSLRYNESYTCECFTGLSPARGLLTGQKKRSRLTRHFHIKSVMKLT